MRVYLGISQLEKPMQLSCKSRLASADGAWQQEFFRLVSSYFYNAYNPEDSEKNNQWMDNVKEINRIEDLRLSCTHGELTQVCCCPQKFVLMRKHSILDIGTRAALFCTCHSNNGKKKDSFSCKRHSTRLRKFTFCSKYYLKETYGPITRCSQTSCGGALCQTFHWGYKTIVMEN